MGFVHEDELLHTRLRRAELQLQAFGVQKHNHDAVDMLQMNSQNAEAHCSLQLM